MQSKIAGIVIIVIGIFMIMYTGLNYVTAEKVIDIGPIQLNEQVYQPVQSSPIAGAILLIGGIAIIASARRKTT